jgi:hypothetical protein
MRSELFRLFCISPAHPGSVSSFLFLDDFSLGNAFFENNVVMTY